MFFCVWKKKVVVHGPTHHYHRFFNTIIYTATGCSGTAVYVTFTNGANACPYTTALTCSNQGNVSPGQPQSLQTVCGVSSGTTTIAPVTTPTAAPTLYNIQTVSASLSSNGASVTNALASAFPVTPLTHISTHPSLFTDILSYMSPLTLRPCINAPVVRWHTLISVDYLTSVCHVAFISLLATVFSSPHLTSPPLTSPHLTYVHHNSCICQSGHLCLQLSNPSVTTSGTVLIATQNIPTGVTLAQASAVGGAFQGS